MPYKSLDVANPSIRGIKPRVTLEQANEIARIADAISETNPDGAWAIAISQFKRKLYVVRGGRWVKRKKQNGAHEVAAELWQGEGERHRVIPAPLPEIDDEPIVEAATVKSLAQRLARDITLILRERLLPTALRKEIEDVRTALRRTWADLSDEADMETQTQEAMKTIDGKDYPASDFLVVEDSESPSTWHLQVKRNGKPDHGLMGAAFAALTKGYRGNKYEGAQKGAAMTKLKAMYKSEDMEMPMEEMEHGADVPMVNPVGLMYGGATSFADLDAAYNAQESAQEAHKRVSQFQMLVSNALADETITDKVAAIKTIADEFVALIGELFADPTQPPPVESASESALKEGEEPLTESASGSALALIEESVVAGDGTRAPVMVDFAMIQPGAGNAHDNHYYPAEILKRDARVFEGMDIFTTDHVDAQRSERTKVGKVKEIRGFTPSGAPIARTILFDPDTAEKTRNRARAGELATLECSILGKGIVKPGKIGGTDYKIVEALTRGIALELVSKAGAGGHALNLAESAGGTILAEQTQSTPESAATHTQEAVTPPAQPIAIQETQTPPAVIASPALAMLAEADIKRVLSETKLPQVAQEWIRESTYPDEKALRDAIAKTTERVKKLTEGGAPFAQGATQAVSTRISESDHQKNLDSIDERYGLKR